MTKKSQHPFLVFGAPQINTPEIDEVVETLRSGWLCTGSKVTDAKEYNKILAITR